ncbi:MAG: hypothetical protein Cons2KO_03900 [Congregibacter sp.]
MGVTRLHTRGSAFSIAGAWARSVAWLPLVAEALVVSPEVELHAESRNALPRSTLSENSLVKNILCMETSGRETVSLLGRA